MDINAMNKPGMDNLNPATRHANYCALQPRRLAAASLIRAPCLSGLVSARGERVVRRTRGSASYGARGPAPAQQPHGSRSQGFALRRISSCSKFKKTRAVKTRRRCKLGRRRWR